MKTSLFTIALSATTTAACYGGAAPTAPAPEPMYHVVDAAPQEVWDAAVDLFVDTGMELTLLDSESRVVQADVLLYRRPLQRARDAAAEVFADCGSFRGEPRAGYGDLRGSIVVRVRESEEGRALLKVHLPHVWQETLSGTITSCVSTGAYENAVRGRVLEHLRPNVAP